VNLSEDCRNFLFGLLVHDPDKRMSYDAFFNHPFLELELVPSDINYKKALKLINEAEHLDSINRHIEAFNTYCQGLKYLFPILEGM
jgi:serine/threonine-protein kinase ULK/ATG1